MRLPFALLAAAILTGAATPQVTVADPVIKGTIATATITTPTDDVLEGLSSPGGIAMLHNVRRWGMVRAAVPLKANTPRRLSAHGYHIMLMHKPKTPTVPIILIFHKAGEVKVNFVVAGK